MHAAREREEPPSPAPSRFRSGVWLAVLGGAAALPLLEHLLTGKSRLWEWLGVPVRRPAFFDGHNLLAALDCARQGLDPLYDNPCDAAGRPLNYPRVWLTLAATGLERGDELAWGLATLLGFLVAALWLARPRSRFSTAVWLIALLSPAVQFGIERGNTELWVFALCVGALALDRPAPGRGAPLVGAAACLKLFPAAGLLPWLWSREARARMAGFAVLALLVVYFVLVRRDVQQMIASVPRVGAHTFGSAVPGFLLQRALAKLGLAGLAAWPWPLVSAATCTVACALAARAGLRHGASKPPAGLLADRAYALGASLYVGSYLLGASWNYRLVFLLLLIPALLHATDRAARGGLALVLAVLWLGGYPRFYLLYVDEWLALALALGLAVQLGARLGATRTSRLGPGPPARR